MDLSVDQWIREKEKVPTGWNFRSINLLHVIFWSLLVCIMYIQKRNYIFFLNE